MKLISTLLLLLITLSSLAQDSVYTSNRPGSTTPPYSVGYHRIAIETGIGYAQNQCQYSNQTLLRYGGLKHLEVMVELDFIHMKSNDVVYSGLNDLIIGAKCPIIQNKKCLPDIGIIGNLILPKTGVPTQSFSLLLQKNINDLSFGCDAGIFWDNTNYSLNPHSTGGYAQGSYSFIIEYSVKRSSVFIETYGYYSKQLLPYIGRNIGVTYMIGTDLQIDLCYGNDIEMNNSYITGGLSWRLPNK